MSSEYRHLEVKEMNGVTIVRLVPKRLESGNIAPIAEELKGLVNPTCKIVLDLYNIKQLFSETLGALVSFNGKVKSSGGKLRLCNLQPDAYDVLTTTQLTRVFDIHDDLREALAGF